MTSYGQLETRVPGARREKMREYLRAANEIRHTYQSQLQQRIQNDDEDMPGSFPDVEIVRSGDEEMLLFPSYARKHVKKHPSVPGSATGSQPGTHEQIERPQSTGDANYWRSEWERYEDANAVVDVDVRGWIYSPHKGPLNRKNRLLIAVARRLSGIPAPIASPATSRASSLHRSERADDRPSRHEEEAAAQEAENIARHGQKEADAAMRGSYSAASVRSSGSPSSSRESSPSRFPGTLMRHRTDTEMASEEDDPGFRALVKRQSWNEPGTMTKEDVIKANEQLMTRLKPFMTMPLASTTITVFFFNDQKSRSKSVTTNESGHFNVRAALDFVPTSVRVLASENLSATEDVIITESRGVSLVSDIDDTIKHSAIASGAREIFKNTFIRELGDLTIMGVKEWYTKLAHMGVKMHYVSNSPWQLYPLLRSYFSLAGLPPGSFHLKHYSGMLQGIFEPAAERKKGSLERIMNDFPERKFILVGDSGEADLEVYTDVVLANPGRVLGVFIRDVTTPSKKGFFDQAVSNTTPTSMTSENGDRMMPSRGRTDAPHERPSLPTRPKTDTGFTSRENPKEEDLIDFSDEPEPLPTETKNSTSYVDELQQLDDSRGTTIPSQPPTRPAKPSNLRQFTTTPTSPTNHDRIASTKLQPQIGETTKHGPPPPRPRRSSKSVVMSGTPTPTGTPIQTPTVETRPPFSSTRQNQSSSATSQLPTSRPHPSRSNTAANPAQSQPSREDEGYVAAARRQLTSAYNALPALRNPSPSPSRDPLDSSGIAHPPPPPMPPRRGLTSYPAAAARWATGATGGDPAAGGDGGAPGASYKKKEEIWRRRWARAEEVMRSKGVVLRTWRVGGDVMEECVGLVERAMGDLEHGGRRGAVARKGTDTGKIEDGGRRGAVVRRDGDHESESGEEGFRE